MLKRKISVFMLGAAMLANSALLAPTYAQEQTTNGSANGQKDNMAKDGKMDGDKMSGDKMAGDKMSGKKHKKHKMSKKGKNGDNMSAGKP